MICGCNFRFLHILQYKRRFPKYFVHLNTERYLTGLPFMVMCVDILSSSSCIFYVTNLLNVLKTLSITFNDYSATTGIR